MEIQQFKAGETYTTRSVCNHDCIIEAHIIKRTAKTITAKTMKGIKTFRVSIYNGAETFKPWGSYSMAPIISAD